jgi:Protein of unknown function (DUF2937)
MKIILLSFVFMSLLLFTLRPAASAASRVVRGLSPDGEGGLSNEVGEPFDRPRIHQTGRSMFARRLALAIAVLAALIGSQAPEFAQQYRQRLGGALEELKRIVSEFDAEVQRQNLSRAEALKRLEDNPDPLARERGEDMGKAIERAERLNEQIEAMNSAGPLMRLYVVATNFDPEIAGSTLDNYEPAEPLSVGALTAGGLAALWGWAATRLVAWPFSRRSRLRAARA